ncbi:PfkB family carbohydrate kinase [Streptomyces sp. R-74717]
MILTVTPNPSLDRTYELPGLTRGAVLRATDDRVDPGGRGINVSRAVAAAGHRTIAVAPLGGPEGALLARLLGKHGIEAAGVPIAGSTRINVTLVEPDGTLTKVNAVGPEITVAEAEALLDAAQTRSATTDWIACCGSLPRPSGAECAPAGVSSNALLESYPLPCGQRTVLGQRLHHNPHAYRRWVRRPRGRAGEDLAAHRACPGRLRCGRPSGARRPSPCMWTTAGSICGTRRCPIRHFPAPDVQLTG